MDEQLGAADQRVEPAVADDIRSARPGASPASAASRGPSPASTPATTSRCGQPLAAAQRHERAHQRAEILLLAQVADGEDVAAAGAAVRPPSASAGASAITRTFA